jgi:methylmalonyl-CoA mutase
MTKTLANEFTIQNDFPAVGYDEWRAVVEESLQGAPFDRKLVTHTYEGIDVQPVYSRRDEPGGDDPLGFPGLAPFVRGPSPLGAALTGWDLRQEYAHPDLSVSNREILDDLQGGATSLLLRLDAAVRHGLDPDEEAAAELVGHDGVMAYSVDDLNAILANVDLSIAGVALDAGAAFLPAAAALVGVWWRRDIALQDVRGAFNADPVAALARDGQLPVPAEAALESLADLAKWTSEHCPHVTAVAVDTSPYHDAGATAAQDIAFGMATAVAYLRALTNHGLDIDTAAQQILFRLSVGTHHFLALAKLRAARQLWSRVVEACGGSSAAGAMRIHARTGRRVLTQRDPYVNLLRNTVAIFAAGLGGADTITSVPFDAMNGLPDSFSRRVARNTVLVLQEEAHLHRVIDPAGGSWFLDQLTEQLADKSWEIFQEVERQGGLLAVLQSGWIADQIDAAYAPREKDIARRKEGITGISEFPDVNEQRMIHPAPDRAALRKAATTRIADSRHEDTAFATLTSPADQMDAMCEAATGGATIAQMARALGFHVGVVETVSPLEARSFAEPFEELRAASDAWQGAHGRRPRVFLANMGPISHHTARATYSKNFFEGGGFEVLSNAGFNDAESAAAAFAESGAGIAVICSSDKLYAEFVPPVAAKLKEAGARCVVLAGNPGDNEQTWRAAGVDRFIFIKCDVLATLRELLREEGVLEVNG